MDLRLSFKVSCYLGSLKLLHAVHLIPLSSLSLLLIDHGTLPYREPASSVHSSPIPTSPPSPPSFVIQ
ncbi:hypothetical protein PM082_024442 [Marasmius tenuissimus]|nr:hypothetical protein PM082_024442 [Marasmius tenuissimus]